jgi:hypothetical protein
VIYLIVQSRTGIYRDRVAMRKTTLQTSKALPRFACLMLIASAGITTTAIPRQEKTAAKKPSAFRLVTPRPKLGSNLTYEDRFVAIEFAILTQLTFKLSNKARVPIEIDWDRASYVDMDGKAHRVLHNGVRYSERDKPQAHTVVPPGATLDDLVHPTDYIRLVKLDWQVQDLFPIQDIITPNGPLKGKTFQLLLPVKVGNISKNYQFVFQWAME